jgi:hypothetical protein
MKRGANAKPSYEELEQENKRQKKEIESLLRSFGEQLVEVVQSYQDKNNLMFEKVDLRHKHDEEMESIKVEQDKTNTKLFEVRQQLTVGLEMMRAHPAAKNRPTPADLVQPLKAQGHIHDLRALLGSVQNQLTAALKTAQQSPQPAVVPHFNLDRPAAANAVVPDSGTRKRKERPAK